MQRLRVPSTVWLFFFSLSFLLLHRACVFHVSFYLVPTRSYPRIYLVLYSTSVCCFRASPFTFPCLDANGLQRIPRPKQSPPEEEKKRRRRRRRRQKLERFPTLYTQKNVIPGLQSAVSLLSTLATYIHFPLCVCLALSRFSSYYFAVSMFQEVFEKADEKLRQKRGSSISLCASSSAILTALLLLVDSKGHLSDSLSDFALFQIIYIISLF